MESLGEEGLQGKQETQRKQGSLLPLPWETFPTPASALRASLFPGEGTQKEAFPSSYVSQPPSYSLFSTFSSFGAIFPPWAPPNG